MSFSVDQIKGIMPALITPYKPDGSVNVEMIRKLVTFHVENGCHGFFVCGSTGEGIMLSREERKLVAQTVVETVAGQVPIMVHVGAVSTNEAVELAKDAKQVGATAVSSLPPIYYPVGFEGTMQHIRLIAQAAELPTFYYHIPKLTGVELTGDQVAEAFTSVEGLVGLKFTHQDMFLMWWILDAAKGKLQIFNGSDQMLLQGLSTGACGGIGSTYNYQIRNIVGVYNALQAGDFEKAREMQWEANRVIRVMFKHGAGLFVEKAIMKLLGFDVGVPRSPMVAFPEERVPALKKDLEEIGFLG